jgi:glycosyltransferase involved in cell wall biosynthesis
MELKKYQPLQQIHTYHSLGAVKYRAVDDIPPIANTRLAVEKACLETAERTVATSPQEQEHMRELISLKGNINIIPCGTDIQRFGNISRSQARLHLGIPKSSAVALYVGRFDRRKGIETLVRAMSHSTLLGITDVRLIIVGGSRAGQSDGIERQRIEGIVDELGLRQYTTFAGQVSQEDLPYYYAAANVSVVPSHYEPFGLVAIEAMASRTPVVAAAVGGLKYTIVSGKTGLLCPPKDERAFAEAIDRILSRPAWQDKLGQAARQRVETLFSWDGVARQLGELYESLLEEPAKELELINA